MSFKSSFTTHDSTAVISLEGDLDAASASTFQRSIDRAVGPGLKRLVLDMSNLGYLSSAGLRQLIYARQKMDDDVRVILVGANDRVTQTIKLVGFDQSVTFTDRIPE